MYECETSIRYWLLLCVCVCVSFSCNVYYLFIRFFFFLFLNEAFIYTDISKGKKMEQEGNMKIPLECLELHSSAYFYSILRDFLL